MFPFRVNHDRERSVKDKSKSRHCPSSSSSSEKHHYQYPNRHSSHGRSSRNSTKDYDHNASTTASTTSSHSSTRRRRSSMPAVDGSAGPSDLGTAHFLEERVSQPYSSFNKAHSREVVGRRDIPTPDPTDVDNTNGTGKAATDGHNYDRNAKHGHKPPPSPPLTNDDQRSSRKDSLNGDGKERSANNAEDKEKSNRSVKTKIRIKSKPSRSSSSLHADKDEEPVRPARTSWDASPKSRGKGDAPSRTTTSIPAAESVAGDSDATSVPPGQQQSTVYHRTTTPTSYPPPRSQSRASRSRTPYGARANGSSYGATPPPPPPPEVPSSIPKVDYLLRLGGLSEQVPKSLLAAGGRPGLPYSAAQPQASAVRVFEPFHRLLNDYHKVMNKSGSLAVATGYRSVARRLLDRLEAVFARDISSESCYCLMCEHNGLGEHPSGVSWGEILELVSGRKELPSWPPFTIAPSTIEPSLSAEMHVPMQKLDIDIPEQFREHYIRQSRKTKAVVDNWLSEQSDQATSSSPPDEIDDDTLTFAILTRLEPEQRPIFCALLGIRPTTQVPRTDSAQQQRHRPASLASSSSAIERLYQLPAPPRDPETAIYMLNNPGIHHVLATLAAISDAEWDILISGRFDGFLRSGAEDDLPPPGSVPSRYGSRSGTPLSAKSFPRKPAPSHMDAPFRPWSQPSYASSSHASFGGPIALDEETEIMALAEVERDIYLGMEALEDAFEALHGKAEVVRRALRERGAGLSMANQSRRGASAEARRGTPSSGPGDALDNADDDWLEDVQSLCPDDSASNISSNPRRRPKRRTERRAPAPVEEEDEEEAERSVPMHSGSGRRHGRRR